MDKEEWYIHTMGPTGSAFGVEPDPGVDQHSHQPVECCIFIRRSFLHIWELLPCSYSGLRPSCGLGLPLVIFSFGYIGDDRSQIPAFRWGRGEHGQSDRGHLRVEAASGPFGDLSVVLLCWRQAWSSVLRWQSCQMPAAIGGGLVGQKEAFFH